MSKYLEVEINFLKKGNYKCVVRKHGASDDFEVTNSDVKGIIKEKFGSRRADEHFTFEQKSADRQAYKTTTEKITILADRVPQSSY